MKKSSSTKTGQSIFPAAPKQDPVLTDIHKKITSSAALNGGFDTLLYKIDKIEQSQGQLVTKVDKIHDAIYDPNDGIFSRLAEYKLESAAKMSEMTQEVIELSEWKKHQEKDEERDEKSTEETSKKVESLEKNVDQLVKNKDTAWSVLKWLGVAVGGGLITLFFSWLQSKIK